MEEVSAQDLLLRIEDLENRLAESEQLIDAIKAGEVDAFAIKTDNEAEVYTLRSGDYAYRVLIEEFGEGALNVTEEGLIVYTNMHFIKLIGCTYEKIVGWSIFDFIDNDSKVIFKDLFSQALTGNSNGEINLSANGKTIPVYVSLTSLQPKLATVGIVITDFTEKKKNEEVILRYQADLEAKNLELLQSNAELASFAYIASHDLQEPLRKIRTFSKYLLDKESEQFSPRTKDYFERIMAASKYMQELITALLTYSRINTSEIVFTPTNLNIVLEEVKNQLHELIEETKTIIQTSALPTLPGVPLQFNQLFTNIVANAIKYRKAGVDPLITITAENNNPTREGELRYFIIRITDNGIGFEQKYSDKIFELFQRLHGKAEYKGTGIGLAICKKIAQNHGGFIKAKGEPGIGSTFEIYLPIP